MFKMRPLIRFLAQLGLLLSALLVASCAGFSSGLVPGVATEAEVEKAMGPSADRRRLRDGETVRFYSRLPEGREMFAARFGPDGKLIAIEQRLTRDNAAKLIPRQSTTEDVLDLFGPPYRKVDYPRLARQVWLYPMVEGAVRLTLNVDLTADGRVYEVKLYDDPDPN